MNNPVAIHGAAHLTLPSLCDGSLPLPPEGRRGARGFAVTLITLISLAPRGGRGRGEGGGRRAKQ